MVLSRAVNQRVYNTNITVYPKSITHGLLRPHMAPFSRFAQTPLLQLKRKLADRACVSASSFPSTSVRAGERNSMVTSEQSAPQGFLQQHGGFMIGGVVVAIGLAVMVLRGGNKGYEFLPVFLIPLRCFALEIRDSSFFQ